MFILDKKDFFFFLIIFLFDKKIYKERSHRDKKKNQLTLNTYKLN
jgi:hypothetical protein